MSSGSSSSLGPNLSRRSYSLAWRTRGVAQSRVHTGNGIQLRSTAYCITYHELEEGCERGIADHQASDLVRSAYEIAFDRAMYCNFSVPEEDAYHLIPYQRTCFG